MGGLFRKKNVVALPSAGVDTGKALVFFQRAARVHAGAEPGARDDEGRSAADLAGGNREILALLRA
ncbi:MAG: hypothetical protein HY319_31440 [Armatimonadetes bacterium]|nr:hypothetical protein [Armatimonadota bacterium]